VPLAGRGLVLRFPGRPVRHILSRPSPANALRHAVPRSVGIPFDYENEDEDENDSLKTKNLEHIAG